jgi:hypothetical protein
MLNKFDHRAARRVYMRKPALAMLSNLRVQVVDISATGFGIEHDFELEAGGRYLIEFRWGQPFMLRCEVVRCVRQGRQFRSGLRISQPSEAYAAKLRHTLEVRALEEASMPSTLTRSAEVM